MTESRKSRIRKTIEDIEFAISEVKDLMQEEQDAFDNQPLGREMSDSDYQMLEAIENLDGAIEEMRDAKGYLEEAIA